MAKAKSTVSHKDLVHGKKAGGKTEFHMKTVMKHKGAKKGGPHAMPKHEGHIDHVKPMHDAAMHEVGSRGPWDKAEKGKHKAK